MSYKNKLLLAMRKSFTPIQYNDIVKMCEFFDHKISYSDVDNQYKDLFIFYEFCKHKYPDFKLYVAQCIRALNYTQTEKDKEITYFRKNLGFYDLRDKLLIRIERIFPKLSEQQQNSLAFDIAWSIHKYMADKDNIDGLIDAYKDVKVLRDIKKEVLKIKAQENLEKDKKDKEKGNVADKLDKRVDSIVIKFKNGEFKSTSKKIVSQNIIKLLLEEYENISIRRFQHISDDDLKKKIKDLRTLKKHFLAAIIWITAKEMIRNGIITEISTIGNKYNLRNENGESYEISNKIGAKIFDVVYALGFDMLKYDKYEKKRITPKKYIEKRNFIKDRLPQASKALKLDYDNLINQYGGLVY